jgi:hypothetical protein
MKIEHTISETSERVKITSPIGYLSTSHLEIALLPANRIVAAIM